MRIHNILLLATYLLLLTAAPVASQTAEQPSAFDLVLFGSRLHATDMEVWLKENPGINDNWRKLGSEHATSFSGDRFTTLVFRGLSTAKFAGQDIRENHIAIRVAGPNRSELRAMYALPATGLDPGELAKKLHLAIQAHPKKLQEYSLASQIRPRPVALSSDSYLYEHIEMPVRYIKAGVQEVKWLDIIFSGR